MSQEPFCIRCKNPVSACSCQPGDVFYEVTTTIEGGRFAEQQPDRQVVEITCPKCQGFVRFFFFDGHATDFAHTVPSCAAWAELNADTKSAESDDYAAQLGEHVRCKLAGEGD